MQYCSSDKDCLLTQQLSPICCAHLRKQGPLAALPVCHNYTSIGFNTVGKVYAIGIHKEYYLHSFDLWPIIGRQCFIVLSAGWSSLILLIQDLLLYPFYLVGIHYSLYSRDRFSYKLLTNGMSTTSVTLIMNSYSTSIYSFLVSHLQSFRLKHSTTYHPCYII